MRAVVPACSPQPLIPRDGSVSLHPVPAWLTVVHPWLRVSGQVTVGPYLCPVVSVTNDSEVVCTLPFVPAATLHVMVVTKDNGMASGLFSYTFPLIVTALSLTSGSVGGGQLVVITGEVGRCQINLPLCPRHIMPVPVFPGVTFVAS